MRLVSKIIEKFLRKYSILKYNKEKYLNIQNLKFKELNFNRNKALDKLMNTKKKNNLKLRPMSSEHEVLFSAISLVYNPVEILEIGTYDGYNAKLLSCLFPKANITTIDLPDDDEIFVTTYNRGDIASRTEFIKTRQQNIEKSEKIIFHQLNSAKLYNFDKKFDLIWVDGAHGYPFVTIDLINSVRLLSENSILMCDDVWFRKPKNQDNMYSSIAAKETLDLFEKIQITKNFYFLKRLDAENNAFKNERKYISLSKKQD